MKLYIFKNYKIKSFFDFFGRLLISLIFVITIPAKVSIFEEKVEYTVSRGIHNFITSALLV